MWMHVSGIFCIGTFYSINVNGISTPVLAILTSSWFLLTKSATWCTETTALLRSACRITWISQILRSMSPVVAL